MIFLFVCLEQGFKEPRKYIAAQGNFSGSLIVFLKKIFLAFLKGYFLPVFICLPPRSQGWDCWWFLEDDLGAESHGYCHGHSLWRREQGRNPEGFQGEGLGLTRWRLDVRKREGWTAFQNVTAVCAWWQNRQFSLWTFDFNFHTYRRIKCVHI